ncbi:MAG: hypothetical protein AB7G28_18030 [Pirellulales bacterium]
MSRIAPLVGLSFLLLIPGYCAAQNAAAPAAYNAASPSAAAPSVTFQRRAPEIGDQLEQDFTVALELTSMVRQNTQVLEKSKSALRRTQRRTVTTTHVAAGVPVAVMVRYAEAGKLIATGPADGPLGESKAIAQPVQGKVYRVSRNGDALLIKDEQGVIPPLAEYEIVALNMESLGRPNPLADFLSGKSIAIGQQVELPSEVAEKLMGLGGDLGKVTRFSITLREVANLEGRRCGIFQSTIEAESIDSSQMRLAVDGSLAIEVDTCRAVEANFAGPIGMSETRGSLSATYQMTGTGKMSVAIASKYSDVQR